jgi:TolB-like protein
MASNLDEIENLEFCERVEKEEPDNLERYFLESNQWDQVFDGNTDVVYGPKKAVNNASYTVFNKKDGKLFDRGDLLSSAEKEKVSSVEAQVACNTILMSEKFAHAPRMCRLLQYLVESAIAGNTRNTSEYAIGIAVFDRDALKYCTTEDPAVRVQVGRLREKLKDFYATVDSNIEISIPLGSYMPVFRRLADTNKVPGHSLVLRQLKCISACNNGESFALGLQEELLHQLYKSFEGLSILHTFHVDSHLNGANDSQRAADINAKHLLEGCIRIDPIRIRVSVRLLEAGLGRVNWSEQFDRENIYDITLQEELALSICNSLKRFMIKNKYY